MFRSSFRMVSRALKELSREIYGTFREVTIRFKAHHDDQGVPECCSGVSGGFRSLSKKFQGSSEGLQRISGDFKRVWKWPQFSGSFQKRFKGCYKARFQGVSERFLSFNSFQGLSREHQEVSDGFQGDWKGFKVKLKPNLVRDTARDHLLRLSRIKLCPLQVIGILLKTYFSYVYYSVNVKKMYLNTSSTTYNK